MSTSPFQPNLDSDTVGYIEVAIRSAQYDPTDGRSITEVLMAVADRLEGRVRNPNAREDEDDEQCLEDAIKAERPDFTDLRRDRDM